MREMNEWGKMRKNLIDAAYRLVSGAREQEASCEIKEEIRAIVNKGLRLRPGRDQRFTDDQKLQMCTDVLKEYAKRQSMKEAWAIVALRWDTNDRAVRYIWQHRKYIGFLV
jgi:hypothetical protein